MWRFHHMIVDADHDHVFELHRAPFAVIRLDPVPFEIPVAVMKSSFSCHASGVYEPCRPGPPGWKPGGQV